jgi:hypothetical protein
LNGASDHDGDGDLPANGEPDSWVEVDVDAAFAAIIARFAETGTQTSADTASATPTTKDPASAKPRPDDDPAEAPPEDNATADDQDDDDQDDDGFVPPVPPPLPRGDFLTTFAWACVIGGPLFLLFAAFAWRDAPGLLVLTGVAAFVGGFVALAGRLPGEPPDDPDDGAVV